MKALEKLLVIVGLFLVAYAIFSRFYGEPSIALLHFKSSNVLLLGNTLLVLSIAVKNMAK